MIVTLHRFNVGVFHNDPNSLLLWVIETAMDRGINSLTVFGSSGNYTFSGLSQKTSTSRNVFDKIKDSNIFPVSSILFPDLDDGFAFVLEQEMLLKKMRDWK